VPALFHPVTSIVINAFMPGLGHGHWVFTSTDITPVRPFLPLIACAVHDCRPAGLLLVASRPAWERLRAAGRALLPVTQPQAGPACQPSCGLRAAGRAHGQPPGAGLGRPPVAQGVREDAGGGGTGKGALYFLYSTFA
jgi:hypothetical protein